MTPQANEALVIDDGRVVDTQHTTGVDTEVDATGQFVLPGFIDAHVHFRLATLNFGQLSRWTEVEFGIAMATLSEQMLNARFHHRT